MHPTIDEQLEGIARLIDRTLERHAGDPSGDRLRTAAGTLRRIAGSWAEMLPFFAWDNAATLELLESVADQLPEEIASRVRAVPESEVDPLSARAAHDRNKELRGLLAEAIASLPPQSAEARSEIAAHLRERIARDPFAGRTSR